LKHALAATTSRRF